MADRKKETWIDRARRKNRLTRQTEQVDAELGRKLFTKDASKNTEADAAERRAQEQAKKKLKQRQKQKERKRQSSDWEMAKVVAEDMKKSAKRLWRRMMGND